MSKQTTGREIKFRALYDDMGGGWKYGMLIYEGKVPRIQIEGTMTFATCLKGTEGQYTGLNDKNGKEIYEGDIVKHLTNNEKWEPLNDDSPIEIEVNSVVQWIGHGFWLSKEYFGYEGEGLANWEQLEIIGNIYENKNLLP